MVTGLPTDGPAAPVRAAISAAPEVKGKHIRDGVVVPQHERELILTKVTPTLALALALTLTPTLALTLTLTRRAPRAPRRLPRPSDARARPRGAPR